MPIGSTASSLGFFSGSTLVLNTEWETKDSRDCGEAYRERSDDEPDNARFFPAPDLGRSEIKGKERKRRSSSCGKENDAAGSARSHYEVDGQAE